MIELSKQRLAAFLVVAAVAGGVVGYHAAPTQKNRPVLKLLQNILKAGSFIWFFSHDEEPQPRQHISHAAPNSLSADRIDHRKAL